MTTTTELGNTFRDDVAALLALTPGLSNVKTEYPIGSQAVDIYYEEDTSVGTRRIACECKNRSVPLTKTKISEEIYPRYNPLLSENLVHHVRIIAPLDINVQARTYVNGCRGFDFVTRDELECRLIDFRSYIRSLQTLYNEDGLDHYYVRPVLNEGMDLEEHLFEWLAEPTARPIAILAGYGMGKTSFARRFAYAAAHGHVADVAARIPILVPLAEIATEQTLSGLLGKLFTDHNRVRNYHFGLFMALNRRGRFLVILDGFDEMKHTMTWEDFKHNLGELHKLVGKGAKVVLLGRPSALMSDLEEAFVLRGLRKEGDRTFSQSGAPDYIQLELQPFTENQALHFIEAYAAYRVQTDAQVRDDVVSNDEITQRLEQVRHDDNVKSLIRRPVQAKMVADLAIDPHVEWRSFSRYELYDEFISRIIERESQKPTRRVFAQEQRRRFVESVSWWLWKKRDAASFDISDLPQSIVEQFVYDDLDASEYDGAVRDLVSGSVLERKTGGKYFFPHRSFIEFLVAGHLAKTEWSAEQLADVSRLMNAEIITFLEESQRHGSIASWAHHISVSANGWSPRFLRLVATAMHKEGVSGVGDRADEFAMPAGVLLDYFRLVQNDTQPRTILEYLVRSFDVVSSTQTKLMCLVAILLAREAAIRDFRALAGRIVVALILNEVAGALNDRQRRHPVALDSFAEIARFAFHWEERPNTFLIGVDWHELYQEIAKQLPDPSEMDEMLDTLTFPTEKFTLAELGNHANALKMTQHGGQLIRFLKETTGSRRQLEGPRQG